MAKVETLQSRHLKPWQNKMNIDRTQPSRLPVRVLGMEGHPNLARLMQKRLAREGYAVTLARDGQEGLTMCVAASYDIVVVDQNTPVYDGLEVIRRLAARGPLPPLIIVTTVGSEQTAVEAIKLGAHDYIVKDAEGAYLDLLPTVIEQVLRQHNMAAEKRSAEEVLRQHSMELERRDDELDALAYTMASDLKGSLSVIIGYGELLIQECADIRNRAMHKWANSIVKISRKTVTHMDELLLLATVRKIDKVALEPLNMTTITNAVQKRLAPLISERRAVVTLPGEWPTAMGYAPWVEEVWAYLVRHAVEHGGQPRQDIPPQVELGADQMAGPQTYQPWIRFWVRDNGPDLALEQQDLLFAEFTQLYQLRTTDQWLGLSVVRRIVEKLGGQVGVENTTGQGNLFHFTLPAAPPPDGEAHPAPKGDTLPEPGQSLDPTDLAGLPAGLLAKLEQATVRINMTLVNTLIDEVRLHNTALANALGNLARDFEYDKIFSAISEARDD